jgi:hypothetical protein
VNYDFVGQRERFDVQSLKGTRFQFSVVVLWNQGVAYTFNDTACEAHDLHGTIQQFCVPENAQFDGQVTIGSDTSALVFVDKQKSIRFETLVTADGNCWPITSIFVKHKVGTVCATTHDYSDNMIAY